MEYKNKFLYSATTNLFYPTAVIHLYKNAGTLPDDAIEISDTDASKFMGDAPVGKVRCAGPNGSPTWNNTPPPTHEEQVAIAEQKRQELLIKANTVTADWRTELALGIISDDDKSKLTAWMQYIKAVKVVDTSVAPNIAWPDKPVL